MNTHKEISLGTGSFGEVYQAKWKGQAVAIKRALPHGIELLDREIAIHCQLKHPNIVDYLGVESVSNTLHLVLEFMRCGDLCALIADGPIEDVLQYRIALDIANALNYLADKRIVHRDLKPDNILLDRRNLQMIAKIADFGMATSEDDAESLKQFGGTADYMAPELFISGAVSYPYSPKSDLYAFAIILWIMIKRRHMFPEDTNTIRERVLLGERGDFSDETHPDYKKLISNCWVQDPKRRTPISNVISQLSKLQASPNAIPIAELNNGKQYLAVLQSITDLDNYGQLLYDKDRCIAGNRTKLLAQHLQIVIKSLVNNTLTKEEAAEKISVLLNNGQHALGQDRRCRDIIAHIILACTGIGLIVMMINKYYTGQFFLNTHRQHKLASVHHAVNAADLTPQSRHTNPC